MITFFKTPSQSVIAVQINREFSQEEIQKLIWLFGEAEVLHGVIISRRGPIKD